MRLGNPVWGDHRQKWGPRASPGPLSEPQRPHLPKAHGHRTEHAETQRCPDCAHRLLPTAGNFRPKSQVLCGLPCGSRGEILGLPLSFPVWRRTEETPNLSFSPGKDSRAMPILQSGRLRQVEGSPREEEPGRLLVPAETLRPGQVRWGRWARAWPCCASGGGDGAASCFSTFWKAPAFPSSGSTSLPASQLWVPHHFSFLYPLPLAAPQPLWLCSCLPSSHPFSHAPLFSLSPALPMV